MSSVIQIRKATREGARLVIGLAGESGSGKTHSALLVAYGMANYKAGKVGFLDTENRRGSLYADILHTANPPTTDQFLIADLYPPFTPERYIQAIHEFQRAGVEVLVVDSVSHEWEGTGGCIEIAEALKSMWAQPKARHKKFVNALLQSDMHVIVCVRAREKDKPERAIVDGKEKTVYRELGRQPIQEKNFMFEMTASLLLSDSGTRQEVLKIPAALKSALGRGSGYLSPADGKAIRDWVDGARKLNSAVENFRNRLISNCDGGVAQIEKCWGLTPPEMQEALGNDFYQTLIASAKEYDALRAEAQVGATGTVGGAPDPAAASIAAAAQQNLERAQRAAAASQAMPPADPPASPPPTVPTETASTAVPATQAAAPTPSAEEPATETPQPAAATSAAAAPRPSSPASTTPAPRASRTSAATRPATNTTSVANGSAPPAAAALRPQAEPLF